MFIRKNFDQKSGIYRSVDNIENFKLRITLKTLDSLIKIPKLNNLLNHSKGDTEDETDEVDVLNLNWQEKRLGRKEIATFSRIENCKSDLHKKYREIIEINNLTDGQRKSNKIFSYTTDDNFVPVDDINLRCKSSIADRIESNPVQNIDDQVDKGDILDFKNDLKIIQKRFENISNFEVMYIMADLEPETVLCTIKWRSSDGLLIIFPDFNNINMNPYLKEIDSDTRHLYQYSIENLSSQDKTDEEKDLKKEYQVLSKLSDLSIKSSSLFKSPPRRCTNVYLFSEITSASHFEYDNIHVRYSISLPNRCEFIADNDLLMLEGSTHSSFKSNINGIHTIGYCHELAILCNDDYRFDDFLKITYQVISIDSWSRERSEGYTMLTIPFEAGMVKHKLVCYRELGTNSILDKLERYFIGDRKKVHLNEFNGTGNIETDKLNRYGNQTTTSGFLYVTNRIILQKNLHFLDLNKFKDSATLILMNGGSQAEKHFHKSNNLIRIDDVIAAYQKAKERLEATTLLDNE